MELKEGDFVIEIDCLPYCSPAEVIYVSLRYIYLKRLGVELPFPVNHVNTYYRMVSPLEMSLID